MTSRANLFTAYNKPYFALDDTFVTVVLQNLSRADPTRVSHVAVQDAATKAILIAANVQAVPISYGV